MNLHLRTVVAKMVEKQVKKTWLRILYLMKLTNHFTAGKTSTYINKNEL